MVMGEYIEQPGKLLAWTLLGGALWEVLGRRRSEADPPSYEYPAWAALRRRIATVQPQVRRLPRPVLGALFAAVILVVVVPIAIRAASTSDYQSSTDLLSAPSGSSARWESTVRRLIKNQGFLRPTAEDGTISASELPGHLSVRFVHGQRLRYSVVARADTPKEARRVASATGKTLVGATYFWRTAALNSKRRSLRRELRADSGANAADRAAIRARSKRLGLSIAAIALYQAQPVTTSKPAPKGIVDRVATDLSGRAALPVSLVWVGSAALIFVLALMAAVLTAGLGPDRRERSV
jgi:hypothetical protein